MSVPETSIMSDNNPTHIELDDVVLSRDEYLIKILRERVVEDSKIIGELGIAVVILLLVCYICLTIAFIGYAYGYGHGYFIYSDNSLTQLTNRTRV